MQQCGEVVKWRTSTYHPPISLSLHLFIASCPRVLCSATFTIPSTPSIWERSPAITLFNLTNKKFNRRYGAFQGG